MNPHVDPDECPVRWDDAMKTAQRILLVDDDPVVLRLISGILGKTYETDAAESAAAAKDYLAARSYSLMFTDIQMPGETGEALIRFVKTAFPQTAVVVVSCVSETKEAKHLIDVGVYGYIVKPFTTHQILIATENALKRRELEMRQQLDRKTLKTAVNAKTAALATALNDLKQTKMESDRLAQNVQNQLFLVSAMMNAMPSPLFYKDIDGKYLGCNPAFCEFLNLPATEIIGKSIRDIVSGDAAAEFQRQDQALLSHPGKRTFETTFRHPDGSISDVVLNKATYQDATGKVAGIVGVILDISNLKKAESALQKAHQEMVELVSGITSIFIGLSPAMTVVQWNKAAEQVFNIPAVQVLNTSFWDAPISWNWNPIREAVKRCTTSRLPVDLNDLSIRRADGKNGFVGLRMTAIESDRNKPTGILVMGADITERKILEAQLTQAQKLEGIGQLAAGIAHEINTPIQYVGDNVRFMKDAFETFLDIIQVYEKHISSSTADHGLDIALTDAGQRIEVTDFEYFVAEVPKAIEQTLEGVNRIGKIVRSMKEFSHPGADEKTSVDINKALESTVSVSRNEWKYVAEVETNFDPTLPLVSCFPGELNQAFLNILVNAAHAIEAFIGTSKDEKGCIRVSTHNDGDGVEIRIGDTGGGVPEGIRNRIFEPFFTTKDVGKGTGQGLAIAYRIVTKKHQGTIRLETENGKGSVFVIRIPYGNQKA